MRSATARGRMLAPVLALAGIVAFAAASPAAPARYHYVVFELDADGVPQPQRHQLVTLAAPRTPVSAERVAERLASPAADRRAVAVILTDDAGRVSYRDLVEPVVLLRTERGLHGEGETGPPFVPLPTPAFVVRVPEGAGSRLRLVVSEPASAPLAPPAVPATPRAVEFDLDALAADRRLPLRDFAPRSVVTSPLIASPANRLDLLLMGDGYTAAQEAKFASDAAGALSSFFAISPYDAYDNFVQATTLFTASTESGADHPPYLAGCGATWPPTCCADTRMLSDPLAGTFVTTAFDASYCTSNIHRLLTVSGSKIYAAAAAVPDWDEILVLVNDTTYGGAGGAFAVFSMHPAAVDVAQHEFGHSFTRLADEYTSPYPGYPPCSDVSGSACEANVTDQTSRSLIKWAPWILPTTPVPTPDTAPYASVVGLFAGARYLTSGMYRPQHTCAMRTFAPFCAICSQEYVLRLYRGGWGTPAAGIDTIEPGSESPPPGVVTIPAATPQTFSTGLLTPTGSALAVTWRVDGVAQSGGVVTSPTATSFDFSGTPGRHTVTLEVHDTTPLVDAAMAGTALDSARTWTADVRPLADLGVSLDASPTTVAPGALLTFTVSVSNTGPDDAVGAGVIVDWPASMASLAWTCAASAGSSCPASGSGAIAHSVTLLVGGTLTYNASGTVPGGATGSLTATASVSAPGGVGDPIASNNSATASATVAASFDYHTVVPCRLVDTRGAQAPALVAGATRSFAVAGVCGVSPTAAAVSINVTVTQPTVAGNLRLFPAGQAVPLVSTINFSAGQTRGNNAVVGLGTGGELAVYAAMASGSAHVVIDVTGYFE